MVFPAGAGQGRYGDNEKSHGAFFTCVSVFLKIHNLSVFALSVRNGKISCLFYRSMYPVRHERPNPAIKLLMGWSLEIVPVPSGMGDPGFNVI